MDGLTWLDPIDDYDDDIIVEMLPGRRCSVRLNDGRVVVCRIPEIDTRFLEPYYPEPGHPVTVLLQVFPDLGGEFLLIGLPVMPRPGAED